MGCRQPVEQRARVCHCVVEEFGEQLVRQIVVVGDVASGLYSAVVLRPRVANHRQRPEPLQRRGNQFDETLRELGEKANQIIGVPVTRHVGLAETNQAVAAHPADQRLRPVDHHRRQCRVGGADHRAVGVDHANRQSRGRTTKQPVGDRGRRGIHRAAGNPRYRRPSIGIDCRRGGSPKIDAHSWPTLSFSTVSVRGTMGTRRSHNVMP